MHPLDRMGCKELVKKILNEKDIKKLPFHEQHMMPIEAMNTNM
jgi:hypothetical protein